MTCKPRFFSAPAALVGVAFVLASCRQEQTAAPLAEVGGESIRAEDLALEMRRTPGREEALQRLIERKRMVAEARATGLADDPETRRALESVLVQRLQEKQLQPELDAIAVSDSDIVARYEATRDQRTRPGTLTLAALFLPSHAEDQQRRQTNRRQLEAVAKEIGDLDPAKGFGSLAVANSQHQESRYRGGILPPFQEGEEHDGWRQELREACPNLTPGALSEVIETRDGLYLARVVERQPGRPMTLDETRESIRRELLREAEERIRKNFADGLEKRHPATTRRDLIDAIPEPPPLETAAPSRPEPP